MSIYNNNNRLERNNSFEVNRQKHQQLYEKDNTNSVNQMAKLKKQKSNIPNGEMQISSKQVNQSKNQFENIDHLENRQNIIQQPLQHNEIKYQKNVKISNQTSHQRLKSKLAFIFSTVKDDQSIGSVSYYEDKSQIFQKQSIQTIGSNLRQVNQDRQTFQKSEQPIQNIKLIPKQSKQGKIYPETMNRQEQKKIKKTKMPAVKYLFYDQIKEQIIQKQLKDNEEEIVKSKKALNQQNHQFKRQQIFVPAQKYEKGKHNDNHNNQRSRLKQKLGFIVDVINNEDSIATVSYYSENKPLKQQINDTKRQQEKNIQPNAIKDQQIIFNRQQANQFLEEQQIKINQQQSKIVMIMPKTVIKQSGGQVSKIFKKSLLPNSKDSVNKRSINKNENNASSKARSRGKMENSFQEIDEILFEAAKRQENTNNKECIKSLSSNPQKSKRYNEQISNSKQNIFAKSIQQKINSSIKEQFKQSKFQKNNLTQSKAKRYGQNSGFESENSNQKLSIKLQHVSMTKAEPKKPINESFQSEKEYQPKTVKKTAQFQKKPKSNENKHLNVNYHQNNTYLEEQLATIIAKNDQILNKIKKSYPTEQFELKKYKTITNTNDIQRSRITTLSPANKIDFKINSQRRLKTDLNNKFLETKDLTQQEKKFLVLLKKREIGLAKRVRQQFTHNNPNIFFPSSQQSKKSREDNKIFSNDSLDKVFDEANHLEKPSFITNYQRAEQKSKLSMNQRIEERPFFPTVNMSSKSKERQHSETFYFNSKERIINSKKNIYNNAKSMRGLSDNRSNDSDKGKSLGERLEELKMIKKQPSKMPFYNIAKMQKDYSFRQKINFNAKQKYQRLKQLLQQI